MNNILSSIAVEGYEIIAKVGSYKVCSLVTFRPAQDSLCENIVELYMQLDSLSAPMKFFICGISKVKTEVQKKEFACNIVDSHATVLLPCLIRWKDCIDSLEKEEVRKAMQLNEHMEYISDAALNLLRENCPKLTFGGMLGRFERQ